MYYLLKESVVRKLKGLDAAAVVQNSKDLDAAAAVAQSLACLDAAIAVAQLEDRAAAVAAAARMLIYLGAADAFFVFVAGIFALMMFDIMRLSTPAVVGVFLQYAALLRRKGLGFCRLLCR